MPPYPGPSAEASRPLRHEPAQCPGCRRHQRRHPGFLRQQPSHASVAGAVGAGVKYFSNSSVLDVQSDNALTNRVDVRFDLFGGPAPGGILRLNGHSTVVGRINSEAAGAGIITNDGAADSVLTVDSSLLANSSFRDSSRTAARARWAGQDGRGHLAAERREHLSRRHHGHGRDPAGVARCQSWRGQRRPDLERRHAGDDGQFRFGPDRNAGGRRAVRCGGQHRAWSDRRDGRDGRPDQVRRRRIAARPRRQRLWQYAGLGRHADRQHGFALGRYRQCRHGGVQPARPMAVTPVRSAAWVASMDGWSSRVVAR